MRIENKKLIYMLHPGFVRSMTDGDWHFVSAGALAELYGVNLSDCIIHNERSMYYNSIQNVIHLKPSRTGEYKLPTPNS